MAISYIGLILSIAVLIILMIRNCNIWMACLVACVILGLTNGVGIDETFVSWIDGSATHFKNCFILFLCGGVFARILDESKCTIVIARGLINLFPKKFLLFTMPIVGGILTYGGISVWMALYAMIPIGLAIMQEGDIPRRYLPIFLLAGTITVGQVAPGSPASQNLIPMQLLNDMGQNLSPSSGLVIGWICTIGELATGLAILYYMVERSRKKGEHFELKEGDVTGFGAHKNLPPMWKAIIGPICAIVFVNIQVFENAGYNILLGGLVTLVLNFKYFTKTWDCIMEQLDRAVSGTLSLLLNMAAVIGFGAAISLSPAFTHIKDAIVGINAGPLVSLAIAVNVIAGICGSASGGEAIVIPLLGQTYLDMGVLPAAMHRVTALASIGLDSLPHNGGICTAIAACNETHKSSYWPIFWLTVVIPVLWSIIAALLFAAFPGLP